MAKCPVCGMEVKEEEALHLEHGGKTYHFCGEGCKEEFAKDPGKYLQAAKEE